MTAVMRTTAAGTLLHEIFHVGVRANFGDIPSWLDESVASLYETAVATDSVYRGTSNWRGEVIAKMRQGRDFRIQMLVGYLSADRVDSERSAPPEFRSDESAYVAALGRYFAMYLQENGKLKAVYMAFRDRPGWTLDMPAQPASIKLIEGATGKNASDLEIDFKSWLQGAIRLSKSSASPGSSDVQKEIPDILRQSPPEVYGGPEQQRQLPQKQPQQQQQQQDRPGTPP